MNFGVGDFSRFAVTVWRLRRWRLWFLALMTATLLLPQLRGAWNSWPPCSHQLHLEGIWTEATPLHRPFHGNHSLPHHGFWKNRNAQQNQDIHGHGTSDDNEELQVKNAEGDHEFHQISRGMFTWWPHHYHLPRPKSSSPSSRHRNTFISDSLCIKFCWQAIMGRLGMNELLPHYRWLTFAGETICRYGITQPLCTSILSALSGQSTSTDTVSQSSNG